MSATIGSSILAIFLFLMATGAPSTQPAGRELAVPVRLGGWGGPVLVGEGGDGAVLVGEGSGRRVARALALMGVLPRPEGGVGEDREGGLCIELRRPDLSESVPLEEAVWFATSGGRVKAEGWRFAAGAGGGDEGGPAVISADADVPGTIEPVFEGVSLAEVGGVFVQEGIGWLTEEAALVLTIRPTVDGRLVVLLDRFGRTWIDEREVGRKALLDAVRSGLWEGDRRVLVLYDPYALESDLEELSESILGGGIDQERLTVWRADGGLGLEVLAVPEHREDLQRAAISRRFADGTAPWQPIVEQQRALADRLRGFLTDSLAGLEQLGRRFEGCQGGSQRPTTRPADVPEGLDE